MNAVINGKNQATGLFLENLNNTENPDGILSTCSKQMARVVFEIFFHCLTCFFMEQDVDAECNN